MYARRVLLLVLCAMLCWHFVVLDVHHAAPLVLLSWLCRTGEPIHVDLYTLGIFILMTMVRGGGVGGGGGGAHTLVKTGIQTGAKQPVPGVQAAPCNHTGTLSDFRGRAYSWDVHVPMVRWLCVAM
jgi:hypothetical protein